MSPTKLVLALSLLLQSADVSAFTHLHRNLRLQSPIRQSATSSEVLSEPKFKSSEEPLVHSYTQEVFIEDTDCFKIVFNGNYLKYYDRALQDFGRQGCNPAPLLDIQRIDRMRFKSSAVLGDKLRIVSELIGFTEEKGMVAGCSRWNQTTYRGTEMLHSAITCVRFITDGGWGGWKKAQPLPPGCTYDYEAPKSDESIDGGDFLFSAAPPASAAPQASKSKIIAEGKSFASTTHIRVWEDEVFGYYRQDAGPVEGLGVGRGGVPLGTSLRYFERARSDALGGATKLRECAEKDGISIVVSKIDKLCKGKAAQSVRPGGEVVVCSGITVRKRSLVTFDQQCFLVGANGGMGGNEVDGWDSSSLVASAEVVCACVDNEGKLAEFPDWVLASLEENWMHDSE